MRKKKRIFTMLLALILLVIMGTTSVAAGYQEERTGSIALTLAVTEDGQTIPIQDVLLSLYKVGAAKTEGGIQFVLDERLADAGVDFGALDTPEQVKTAAQKLEAAVKDSGISVVSQKTDQNGKVFFNDLEKGMYLVVQGDGENICRIAPMLLSVPYSEDGVNWQFDINASPKAEKKEYQGTLVVEKRVLFQEGSKWVEKNVKNKTYYVSLFLDEEATLPYGEIKRISIENDSRGTAVWKELSEGTYYLRETDSKGNPVPLNKEFKEENGSKVNCVITVDGQKTTRLDFKIGDTGEKKAVVENRYPEKTVQPPAKTGDTTKIMLWAGGLLVAGAVIVVILKRKRK